VSGDGPPPLDGAGPTLTTARLVLRPWRESDLEQMAAVNGDPETMRYFPAPLNRAESDAFVAHMDASFALRGSGLWAVEVPGTAACIGAVGLLTVGFEAHFTPATEVGWRLGREHWGKGYATEAATEALRYAFEDLDLSEIVSFTAAVNLPSIAVMERLGMHRDPDGEFSHPRIAADHRLAPHVLYRLGRPEWAGGRD
jgi:RimJ/RimL family protein N-acetyltransferase